MSTLFALVKTHNYLIYISFPPQNWKPLCTSALGSPPPPTLLRRQLESSSNQLPSCVLEKERLPWVRLRWEAKAGGQKTTEKRLMGDEMLRQEVQVKAISWAWDQGRIYPLGGPQANMRRGPQKIQLPNLFCPGIQKSTCNLQFQPALYINPYVTKW